MPIKNAQFAVVMLFDRPDNRGNVRTFRWCTTFYDKRDAMKKLNRVLYRNRYGYVALLDRDLNRLFEAGDESYPEKWMDQRKYENEYEDVWAAAGHETRRLSPLMSWRDRWANSY